MFKRKEEFNSMEAMIEENAELTQQVKELQAIIDEYEGSIELTKETLIVAQKAKEEYERLIKENKATYRQLKELMSECKALKEKYEKKAEFEVRRAVKKIK